MVDISWDREERWADCPIFPDRYEISSIGNIRSKSYLKQGRNRGGIFSFVTESKPIAKGMSHDGYYQVRLQAGREKVSRKIHRLVALAFIPVIEGKNCVNHKDSNRLNNSVDNLEWCTQQENVKHGYDSGSNSNAKERHPQAIYSDDIAKEVRELVAKGNKPKEVASMLGVNYSSVIKIKNNKRWV